MSADNDSDRAKARPGDELTQLAEDLGDHYFWVARVLARAGVWQWLVPWPLLALGHKAGLSKSNEHGSVWLTAVGATSVLLGTEQLQGLSDSLAGDAARTIYTAAFLVMTMLSLSVALPGQAIVKLVLGSAPLFAAEFVAPTLWAFIWGMVGGPAMMLYPCLGNDLKMLASVLALYAFAMAVNAVLFTIRIYVIGLVLTARKAKQDASKGEACSAGQNCG